MPPSAGSVRARLIQHARACSRRTAATWLRQELGDKRLVAEYLGHADLSTVARYAHVARAELLAAAGRLEQLASPTDAQRLSSPARPCRSRRRRRERTTLQTLRLDRIAAAVVIVDGATVASSRFVPDLSLRAAARSACRPWRACSRPEFALEAVEQVEKADALPGAVSTPDGRLPEHSRLFKAEDRLACALLSTSE